MVRRLLLTALAAFAIGAGCAAGSLSATLDVMALELDVNLEQQVATIEGWTVYAGSGFGLRGSEFTRFQPYVLMCRAADIVIVYAELCGEVRAPLVGDGSFARVFVSITW